jgi:hypothetical protein
MSSKGPNPIESQSTIRSGPEIVSDFIASLKNDQSLDPATVDAISALHSDKKLTFTNLLRSLEDARGKTSV